MLNRKSDSAKPRTFAAISLDAGDTYLAVFDFLPGADRPRFASLENPPFEDLKARLSELSGYYRETGIDLERWIDLPGLGAHLASSDVPGELAGATPDQQRAGALAALGLDESCAADSAVAAVVRDGACHAAAVLLADVDSWAEALGTDSFSLVARAHALEALLSAAHPEAADGPVLAIDVGRSTVAAFARTATGRVCHVQFDTSQLVPTAGHLAPAVVHDAALVAAIASVREHLADHGEHPDGFGTLFIAGTALSEFDARATLARLSGPENRQRILPLKSASAVTFPSESESDRERARNVLSLEHGLSAVFGLAAVAASRGDCPIVSGTTHSPLDSSPSGSILHRLLAATRSQVVATALWSLPILLIAACIHLVGISRRSAANEAFADERRQSAVYAQFAVERAAVETKLRHQKTVVETVDRERSRQAIPIAIVDDVLACYRLIPPPPGATPSIANRTTFTSISWSGSIVTIAGSTTYQENAREFARALGEYRTGGTFSAVTPEIAEVVPRTVANEEPPAPSYTFTITATYEPAPAAAVAPQNGGPRAQ